jgi:peptidyl-prolyl cis-trans isomerase A (cyclophilin A)
MKVPQVSKLVCLIALMSAAIGCENSSATHDPKIDAVDANGSAPPQGPDEYWVKFDTTRGDVFIEVHRRWSPYGADRFYELVKSGFYDGCKFFRVAGFVVQFGLSGDPTVNAKWHNKTIPDDEKGHRSNNRGYVTFAKGQQPNSRTTQVFINCIDNDRLDAMGFTPFGKVISGMQAIDALYSEYGEEPTQSQYRIEMEGDAYLSKAFPMLDSIQKATLLDKKPEPPKKADANKTPEATPDHAKQPAEQKPSASPPAPAKKAG